jgi:tetratricopeptide (TPR) repeat protein
MTQQDTFPKRPSTFPPVVKRNRSISLRIPLISVVGVAITVSLPAPVAWATRSGYPPPNLSNIARSMLRKTSVVALFALAVATTACGKDSNAANDSLSATAAATDSTAEDKAMAVGLDQLYQANDPISAASSFRQVLSGNPTHYGAHFQLAKSLDLSGHPDSARLVWNKFLPMAEAIKDTASISIVQARLAQPDTASHEALMNAGLSLLYKQQPPNPAGAADYFRRIIARNATHYGAHFQLARALDASGKSAEAREIWIKVLGMATAIKDASTADTARARLARKQ